MGGVGVVVGEVFCGEGCVANGASYGDGHCDGEEDAEVGEEEGFPGRCGGWVVDVVVYERLGETF